MLRRTLRFCFSQGHKHLNHGQINAKMGDLRQDIKKVSEQISQLTQKVKQKEAQTARKNKLIHEKRVKLTEDVNKGQKVWENAKKQSEAHKSNAIQSFAKSLVALGDHFNEIKRHQNDQHSVDLREGFENTARLFFNTLQKFKIKQIQIEVGSKVNKDLVEIVGQEDTKQKDKKDTIHKVIEPGWMVQNKVVRKAKVIVYDD